MNVFPPMLNERLFVPFLDEVDGTLCLPASATAAEIAAQTTLHQLRFPLLLDESLPLRDQIAATTHASASCRFGPFCDNILGMNWRLPSGRIARIGERVVKTTTGYDWLRFLLHSGSRFGEPTDYVVRLRPDCGFTVVALFEGTYTALENGVSQLLHSGWMHWWDAVDFMTDATGSKVRVVVHCVPSEVAIFVRQLERIASSIHAHFTLHQPTSPPFDGLPDLVLKTTVDRVQSLASELSREVERSIAFCYCGVLHLYLKPGVNLTERIHALAQKVAPELHDIGGDWCSRWLPAMPPTITESPWLQTLEQAIHDTCTP